MHMCNTLWAISTIIWVNPEYLKDSERINKAIAKILNHTHESQSPHTNISRQIKYLQLKLQEQSLQIAHDKKIHDIVTKIHESSYVWDVFQYVIESIPYELWLSEYKYHITHLEHHQEKNALNSIAEFFYALITGYGAEKSSPHINLYRDNLEEMEKDNILFPLVLRDYSRSEWMRVWEDITVGYISVHKKDNALSLKKQKNIRQSLDVIMSAVENYLTPLLLEELNTILNKTAITDALTGISNRLDLFRKFKEITETMPDNKSLAVFLLDIDKFKSVNDIYGHNIGDEVLKNIANAWKEHFENGVFARLGWEEFVALCLVEDEEEALRKGEELRISIALTETSIDVSPYKLSPTASIGIVLSEKHTKPNLDTLLMNADQAMYAAKDQWRNKVCLWVWLDIGNDSTVATNIRARG